MEAPNIGSSTWYKMPAKAPNCVLALQPLGKPNSDEPYTDQMPDPRSRVTQTGKENHCTHNVLKTLAISYGKKCPEQFQDKRKVEKLVSQRRKQISESQKNLPWICDQVNSDDQICALLKKINLENVDTFLAQRRNSVKDLDAQFPSKKSLLSVIDDFKQQKEFYDLLNYVRILSRKDTSINEGFFKSFNTDFSTYYCKTISADIHHYINQGKALPHYLNTFQKILALEFFAFHLSVIQRGLSISRWTPKDKIDVLINEISAHGPVGVQGIIGTYVYNDAPTKIWKDKIGGKEIHYWPESTPMISPKGAIRHCVVVNGAVKNSEGEFVIISDTAKSDPQQPDSFKLFMIPYEIFKKSVCDMTGEQRESAPPEIGYIFYRP